MVRRKETEGPRFSQYPAFAIAPANLRPPCSNCNKTKGHSLPRNTTDQTLHPYYDRVDDVQWLFALLIEEDPVAVTFEVKPPVTWSSEMAHRVQFHFEVFGLARLYTSYAGEEISGIIEYISRLFDITNAEQVRAYLVDMARSRARIFLNSWQHALYAALSQSEWFCNAQFRKPAAR